MLSIPRTSTRHHSPFPTPRTGNNDTLHPDQRTLDGYKDTMLLTGGSNDIPVDPKPDTQPTPAERLQQAKELAKQKAEHIQQMRLAIEDEERAHDEHARYWNLPMMSLDFRGNGNTKTWNEIGQLT
ncbi:uncharacterized protein ARMOST_08559 [Armillaria ostoyae]|uniref:Uncharacterized protein n=1 Tax=Armillaria ostoyae TaxID=47428 RepID=A0A284R8Y6_ARMOS|nr:uncharacterized protein ARMOST_08559 [Armillaria ostoyae]